MDNSPSHEYLNGQWNARWLKNEIGFHAKDVQPWLMEHWPVLTQRAKGNDACVFVPLCGKTLDIEYFLKQGYQVVGCDLSDVAVQQLFESLGITPKVSDWAGGVVYQGPSIRIYVGDVLMMGKKEVAGVDYIYDRAALIALPINTRRDYIALLHAICPTAKLLVITLDYDQSITQGPPYAVSEQEIQQQFQAGYRIQKILHENIIEDEPRFKKRGLLSLHESLYWLEPLAKSACR